MPVLEELTPRQKEYCEAIRKLTRFHGHAPTYREIANEMGLASISPVQCVLPILKRKGWITYSPDTARSIVLKREQDSYIRPRIASILKSGLSDSEKLDLIEKVILL